MKVDKYNIIDAHIRKNNHTSIVASKMMKMNPAKLTQMKAKTNKPSYENYMKLRDYGISEQDLRKHFEGE